MLKFINRDKNRRLKVQELKELESNVNPLK